MSRSDALLIFAWVWVLSLGMSVIHRKTAPGSGAVLPSSAPNMTRSMSAVAMMVLPAPVVAVSPTAWFLPLRTPYRATSSSVARSSTAVSWKPRSLVLTRALRAGSRGTPGRGRRS